MGFPSPAADYVSKRIDLNEICGVMPGDTVFVATDGGYALLSKASKPLQGDMVLLQNCGSTQFARIQGRGFITEDGEAIEGDILDEVVVIGKVTFLILSAMQESYPVI